MLIVSVSPLVKTGCFMCLISPTHYTIQYCLRWQEAAYRAQLHRSISEMLRHGCAGARRSGGAAGRSLGVRCGLLPQRGNDSSEISFHVSLPCLQKRIGGGTSPNIGPALSSTCLAVGPSPEDGERERARESPEWKLLGHGRGRRVLDKC